MTGIRFPNDSHPWQKEADVVIVGFGGAGAVSAGIVFSPVDVEAATEYFRALSCYDKSSL
jgi:hypothetical protein